MDEDPSRSEKLDLLILRLVCIGIIIGLIEASWLCVMLGSDGDLNRDDMLLYTGNCTEGGKSLR